mmetsp:Transcript_44040/g.70760  ORF Transcript_44040/g.70760 Transcript_44040/m.70760 type:complete len:188 (+) Transcript_44040:26-589(+)
MKVVWCRLCRYFISICYLVQGLSIIFLLITVASADNREADIISALFVVIFFITELLNLVFLLSIYRDSVKRARAAEGVNADDYFDDEQGEHGNGQDGREGMARADHAADDDDVRASDSRLEYEYEDAFKYNAEGAEPSAYMMDDPSASSMNIKGALSMGNINSSSNVNTELKSEINVSPGMQSQNIA